MHCMFFVGVNFEIHNNNPTTFIVSQKLFITL